MEQERLGEEEGRMVREGGGSGGHMHTAYSSVGQDLQLNQTG